MTHNNRPLPGNPWPLLVLLVVASSVLSGQKQTGRSASAPALDFDVIDKTIPELQAAMTEGRVSARQLTALYLARIEAYDRRGPRINAMIGLHPRALELADSLDRERATGRTRGPLHGIPIVIKDNFNTSDMPTTAGSLSLAGFVPQADAFQVRRLREAGAIIVGKTNMHELASGITTISSLGGQTLNPYDLTCNPGGSSGGTGAAVAANFVAAGMGSDTCGSIRIPASHNSLVGLRPTLGLSSRTGVIPLSHTQDVAGPIARSVVDLAIMLDATVASDPNDPTTNSPGRAAPSSYASALRRDALKGARIGILETLFGSTPEDQEVTTIVRRALEDMKKLGAELVSITVPGLEDNLRDSGVIDQEFKFDLLEYLEREPRAPVRSLSEIIDKGLYHRALENTLQRRNKVETRESESYRRALIKRALLRQSVLASLDEQRLVALAYPTLRRRPALIGETQRGSNCQLSASAGLPALSLPAGFTTEGLPIGLELLGRAFSEIDLLSLALHAENALKLHRPPPTTPALIAGKPPAPQIFVARTTGADAAGSRQPRSSATARFTFDPTTMRVDYQVSVGGFQSPGSPLFVLRRGAPGSPGPVLFHLTGTGASTASGFLTLSARDRDDLLAGRLLLSIYPHDSSTGLHAPLRRQ